MPKIKRIEAKMPVQIQRKRVAAYARVSVDTDQLIDDGDVLFSWFASLEVMYWTGGKAGLNQHIFKVVPKVEYSKEFVYHQLTSYIVNFVKMAEARKTTMGHITSDHMDQSRIILPPITVLQQFHASVASVHSSIIKYKKENRELSKLRDWLLPMLMNGQVRVEV